MFNLELYNQAKLELAQAYQYFNNLDANSSQAEIDGAIYNINSALANVDVATNKIRKDNKKGGEHSNAVTIEQREFIIMSNQRHDWIWLMSLVSKYEQTHDKNDSTAIKFFNWAVEYYKPDEFRIIEDIEDNENNNNEIKK